MSYSLHQLQYAYDALAPFIDEQTDKVHHDGHHWNYIKKLNLVLEKIQYPRQSLEHVLHHLDEIPADVRQLVRDNAGGFFNHNLYWAVLSPRKQTMSDDFKRILCQRFGSLENLINLFTEASMNWVGSGWTWLYVDEQKNLQVGVTLNHDNPLMAQCHLHGVPLLTLDLWEHAYYLKYKNDKRTYFEAFWERVAWEHVEMLFKQAK